MALTRSRRMLLMAEEGCTSNSLYLADETQASLIPKYESTKGTSYFERELTIRGWNQQDNILSIKENPIDMNEKSWEGDSTLDTESEDKTSGSEYIPSDEERKEKVFFFPRIKLKEQKITVSSTNNRVISNRNKKKRKHVNIVENDSTESEDNALENEYIPIGKKMGVEVNSEMKTRKEKTSQLESHPEQQNIVSSTSKDSSSNQDKKIKILSNILIQSSNTPQEPTNSISISSAAKSYDGKRIRNKKHSCYYCHKMVLHMAAHLQLKHEQEMDVARALAFPKNSSNRKTILSEITRAGDFHHNCEVMSSKHGELILVRRPTKTEFKGFTYRDYGPCPNCLGFLLKKNLWHHAKTQCVRKSGNDESEEAKEGNKGIMAESESILSNVFGTGFSAEYIKYIKSTLRNDLVGGYCRDDALILKYGAMLFEKYGTTQCELIRQNMRQLARLIMTIEEITSHNWRLADLLKPDRFDLLVQGVKILCCQLQDDSTKRPQFKIPSLALKLGYSLRKCANIERGVALRQQNLSRNENLIAFCTIMDLEWQIKVSSNALTTLHSRKINAGELLPVTTDLLKCNRYIQAEMQRAQTELLRKPNSENWYRLAKCILCRIILFNKRRAGEASKMTLEQFTTRPSWSEKSNQEIHATLTPYEIKLADRHTIVNIIGKRGRFVPVLLTPECKIGIDILNSHREKIVGINLNNPYIFARGGQAMTSMRGPDVLRSIVAEIEELEKPQLITSTKLRKYIATVSQVFDLSENDYDWLARHLGHDIKVHRQFYRLHEDVVELTKVSRLLMAVDLGQANAFAGKKLEDIQLTELPPIEDDEINEEDDNDFQETIQDNEDKEVGEALRMSDMSEVTEVSMKQMPAQKKSVQVAGRPTRTPWTTVDKKAVWDYFRIKIKHGILPGKKECEECQAKYPGLQSRKWTDIKFCVKNEITKMQKLRKC